MNWATDLSSLYVPGDGTARVFGVVVYTRAHANIKRVLDDNYYWEAFDEVSGPRWNVFAVRAAPGHYDYPESEPGMMQFMVPIWKEPDANKKLLADFGLDSTKHLPCLVVFAPADSGELLATAIKLNDATMNEAYGSIKDALNIIAASLDEVLAENLPEVGAFRAVELSVLSYNRWRRIKSAGRVLERIVNVVG